MGGWPWEKTFRAAAQGSERGARVEAMTLGSAMIAPHSTIAPRETTIQHDSTHDTSGFSQYVSGFVHTAKKETLRFACQVCKTRPPYSSLEYHGGYCERLE